MENGTKTTCEDLPLNIVIDFASQNGLPVSIVNGSGTYSASSEMFNNISDFRNTVLTTTAASDLQRAENTTLIDLRYVSVGDLILAVDEAGAAGHAQVVTSRTENSIGIHQGSFVWHRYGSANPKGTVKPAVLGGFTVFVPVPYKGSEVNQGTYTRNGKKDQYIYRRPGTDKQPELINNSQIRRWNFQAWGSE